MAVAPCSLCSERYYGPSVTGYHAWYDGSTRKSWKQKICDSCAKNVFGPIISISVSEDDPDAQYPDNCPSCGEQLGEDVEQTWMRWYRKQNQRNLTLVQCPHCAAKTRTTMMMGAEKLADRELAGVREGGAPLPNPPGFGSRADLPW